VALERFLVGDLPGAGYLKPFLGTRVCFYLWHFFNINFYTLLAFRTGGNLWSLVGNPATGGNRAAKVEKKIKRIEFFEVILTFFDFKIMYFASYEKNFSGRDCHRSNRPVFL
jgi:hypothetical protein